MGDENLSNLPNNYMTNVESSAKAHEIHHPTKL